MSQPTKYGPPLKLFNIMGASELRQSRIMVAMMFVLVGAAGIIALLVFQAASLTRANEDLSNSRIMYGFPNAEGVFVSEKHIPDRHIQGFTTWFTQNYYNFTPESAQENATEALRIMSPRLRVKQEEILKQLAQQSYDQRITQAFAIEGPISIERSQNLGYIVHFKGARIRATMNRVFNSTKYDVKLLLRPVKPSAHFEWALVVDDFIVQEI